MRTKSKKRRARVSRPRSKPDKKITTLLSRFGNYLTQRREADNLTLRTVAEKARMPHSSVYQIEQSNKDPHLSELVKLARAFSESAGQFLGPFLQEHEEPLEAPAEGAERKESFAEIPPPENVSEMPMNRSCDKCGYVHAVGMICPGPDAVNAALFGYKEP